jgi:hypothetical protein
VPAVRQKLHLASRADFRGQLSGRLYYAGNCGHCHFFVSWSRNFAVGKSWVTDTARKNNDKTVYQDLAMIEAQQRILDRYPDRRQIYMYVGGAQIRS